MIPMNAQFQIGGTLVGEGCPPFVIAELSANHGGSFDRAMKIIKLSAEAGAHAIKFQAYTAESLTLDCDRSDFIIKSGSLWAGQKLADLYRRAATPYEWFPELFSFARSLNIIPFASAFGIDAIEMLEPLNPAAYKIASFEAVDLELIAAVARTGRPLIISTGLCTNEDVFDALAAAASGGARNVMLLKCSSSYPAPLSETNLLAIPYMQHVFGAPVGFSDHTLGPATAIAACALGACAIEKHVIDDRHPATADSAFSALPNELAALVQGCKAANDARGKNTLGPTESENKNIVFRRSLYAVAPIKKGALLTKSNVKSVRPGFGLKPKFLDDVINRKAVRDIAFGEPINWDVIAEADVPTTT
jgi:N-acetylneuraminate synthase